MGSPSVLQVGEARNLRGERFSAFKVVIYSPSKATLGSQEVGRGQPVRLQVGGATCVGLGPCEANVLRLSRLPFPESPKIVNLLIFKIYVNRRI